MRDQVIVSENGHLGVAVPLYRWQGSDALMAFPGFAISISEDKPLAYAIDFGPEIGNPVLMNAEFAESRFVFLGDLESPDREGDGE